MIICYLADGASIHTQRWVGHFAGQGHSVHLISFTEVNIPGVATYALTPQRKQKTEGDNWHLLFHLPAIKRLLKTIRPDIIHTHFLTSYGLLGALSGHKPLVGTAWGSDVLVTPQKSLVYRLLLKYVFSQCAAVTSDSSHMGEVALNYGLRPDKLIIIPFGLDLQTFNQEGRLCPETPPFELLSMRFLDANANTQYLLKALPHVLAQMPEVKLTITHHGPELNALQDLVSHLSLTNTVEFKGLLPHNQVPSLLKRADLYFSLLSHDATSVSLLEAMACGPFPIVSDIPANREWVSDGKNGYLVPPQDSAMLAEKIMSALKQSRLRQEAAQFNWQLVRQKANWEANMQTVAEIYHSLQ